MDTPSNPQGQPAIMLPPQGIYINGFGAGVTSGDVYVVMMRNGIHIGVLNLSYTVAKSLGQALTQLVSDFEKDTDHTIMTSSDVADKLEKKQSSPKPI